jgi:hypothetical protein
MRSVRREIAFGEMQIGATDATRRHLHEDFARSGRGISAFAVLQWERVDRSGSFDPPCMHCPDLRTGATMLT